MSMDITDVERIFEVVAQRVRGMAGELGEDLMFIEVRIPRLNALHKFTLGYDEVSHTESHDMETTVQLVGANSHRALEQEAEQPIPLSIEL